MLFPYPLGVVCRVRLSFFIFINKNSRIGGMTNYQLYIKSGVPKSTIGNLVNCTYDSVKLRVIHEVCQGFGISITEFFNSPLFAEDNLEP